MRAPPGILALVMMMIGAMIVLPARNYTMTVTKSGRTVQNKVERAEAVKGGLRTVLADGKGLYQACKDAGISGYKTLASPGLNVGVSTTCTKTNDTLAEDPGSLWYAGVSTWAGSMLPGGMSGGMYVGLGQCCDNCLAELRELTPCDGSKVWTPQLPVADRLARSNVGYGDARRLWGVPGLLPRQVHRSGGLDRQLQLLLRLGRVLLLEHVSRQW